MAKSRVGGKNGGCTLPTGHYADISAWTLNGVNPTDDDTSYNTTTTASSHIGSGTVDYNGTASGFVFKGTTVSSTGITSMSATGGSLTLTADTGCSVTGPAIVSNVRIDHRKRSGAIPVAYDFTNGNGEWAETWATT